jgi:probable HAF family extracellular repeat protein
VTPLLVINCKFAEVKMKALKAISLVCLSLPVLFADPTPSAALFQNGTTTFLGSLGGAESDATGINDNGQVVGYAQNAAGLFNAFIWQNGIMTNLGVLPGRDESYATAINASGEVIGYSVSSATHNDAQEFVWQNGVMTEIGDEFPVGINSAGQVLGSSGLWQDGIETQLSPLPDGSNFAAQGINNSGQMLGIDANLLVQGLLVNGVFTPIQTLSGMYFSPPPYRPDLIVAMNDNGQFLVLSSSRASLLQNGVLTPLNIFGSDSVVAINDSGQIIGSGIFGGYIWQDGTTT